jgi:4-amino-4-deoxy-L-arabinose transferase-like glycosyltransferase
MPVSVDDSATAKGETVRPFADQRRIGFVLLALALSLRLIHLVLLHRGHPELFDVPVLDAAHYHRWALDILNDRGLANELFFMHPAYPYLIAAIYKVFGTSPLVVAVVQCVLDALSVVLIYRIVCSLFPDGPTGLIAGASYALYWPLIAYTALLDTTTSSIFLVLLAIFLLTSADARTHPAIKLLAGLAYGCACFSRGNFIACIPIIFLIPFLSSAGHLRARLKATLPLVLGVFVVFAAVGTRNYTIAGKLVSLTTSFGPNLYLGHHPGVKTAGQQQPPFVRPDPRFERADYQREAERISGRKLEMAEVSDFWKKRALAIIVEDPARSVKLFANKVAASWGAWEISDNYSLYYLAGLTALGSSPLPSFISLAGLALLGMGLALRRWKELYVIYAIAFIYPLTLGIFFVSSRYRIPMVPFLIPFAAHAIVVLSGWVKARQLRNFGLGMLVVVTVTSFSVTVTSDVSASDDRAQALNSHGVVYIEAGNPSRAAELFREAATFSPANAKTWTNLGMAHHQNGDTPASIAAYQKAIELGMVTPELYNAVGTALFEMGDAASAELYLRNALQLSPRDHSIRFNLALMLGRSGKAEGAKEHLEIILREDPSNETARRALEMSVADKAGG